MIDAMHEVAEAGDGEVAWKLRSLRGNIGRAHLAFGACSRPHSKMIHDLFNWWVQLRHHDMLTVTGDVEGLTTVGVLLTPRPDGRRPWDTTLAAISGDPELTSEELDQLREIWPTAAVG